MPARSFGTTVSEWAPFAVMALVPVEPGVQAAGAVASIWQLNESPVSPVKVIAGGTATGVDGTPLNVTAGGGVRSTVQVNDAGWLARKPCLVAVTENVCEPAASPV